MSLLRSITALFDNKPVIVRMLLANEAIRLGILRDGKLLTLQELERANVRERFPDALTAFLTKAKAQDDGSYRVPYPAARKLASGLKPLHSKELQIECDAVLRLKTVPRPADFKIDYTFTSGQLIRQIHGAERHLGGLWFQQGEVVWNLLTAPPNDEIKWLVYPSIPANQVVNFVMYMIPACKQASLPVTCFLTARDDVKLTMRLTPNRDSAEILIDSNAPNLLPSLEYLGDDPQHMIAANTLLLNLRPAISNTILEIARNGGKKRLTWNILLPFLYDELRPRANMLGIDWAEIGARYPVIPATQWKLQWHLEYRVESGIGFYEIMLMLHVGSVTVPARKLVILHSLRFYPLNERLWLEITPSLREQLKSTDLTYEGALSPSEILGSTKDRLSRTRLPVPRIPSVDGNYDNKHALATLQLGSTHCIPVLFSGLQVNALDILVTVCQRILKGGSSNCVLWVVGQRKRQLVINALEEAKWQFRYPSEQIVVVSPDDLKHGVLSTNWALIIFHDLDMLATNTNQTRLYGNLKRRWTVGTLANESSIEDRDRFIRILQAFQLSPSDSKAFIQKCFHKFQDQREGLITRLTSPFKRLVLDDAAKSEPGLAIPPRPMPPPPTTLPEIPQPTFRITGERIGDAFLVQARRLANYVEHHADPVPFMQYFPTYDAMTPAQRKWYFYWRSQLRAGNWLPTDLSYQFVHVYEAINVVGFNTPQAAFDHLTRFWRHYRTMQPKLDRYLADWIADFAIIHRLQQPLDWYASVTDVPSVDPDLRIEAWLRNGGNWDDSALNMIFRIADYDPTKNKFFKEHDRGGAVAGAYLKGLRVIDDYVRQSKGTSLIAQMQPAEVHLIRRPPFASAIHDYKVMTVDVAQVHDWQSHTPLAEALTAILKYSENLIRPQMGVTTKLRGFTLSPEWAQALDTAFGVKSPVRTSTVTSQKRRGRPRKNDIEQEEVSPAAQLANSIIADEFVIDMSRVSGLIEESDSLRDRLTVTEQEETATTSSAQLALSETPEPAQNQQAEQTSVSGASATPKLNEAESDEFAFSLSDIDGLLRESDEVLSMLTVEADSEENEQEELADSLPAIPPGTYLERPANTPAHLLTDLREIALVLGQPNSQASRILTILRENDWQLEAKALAKLIDADFINVEMGYLNDTAAQQLGDSLVLEENGVWVVAEDYRDELEYILTHPEFVGNLPANDMPRGSSDHPDHQSRSLYAELPVEWSGFAQRLQAHHWESIAVFVQGADVPIRLDAIARASITTATRLVDELNEYALDTVGDYVIETSAVLSVDDDVRESFAALLGWAARHNIAEM